MELLKETLSPRMTRNFKKRFKRKIKTYVRSVEAGIVSKLSNP
jgi:hypothetical protein